ESAMLNMLTKQERAARLSNGFGIPSNNFRMKRTVSLPNTTSNVLPPVPPNNKFNGSNTCTMDNKVMEVSTSSSSGYSSMGKFYFEFLRVFKIFQIIFEIFRNVLNNFRNFKN